jgi:hypothetical protein
MQRGLLVWAEIRDSVARRACSFCITLRVLHPNRSDSGRVGRSRCWRLVREVLDRCPRLQDRYGVDNDCSWLVFVAALNDEITERYGMAHAEVNRDSASHGDRCCREEALPVPLQYADVD